MFNYLMFPVEINECSKHTCWFPNLACTWLSLLSLEALLLLRRRVLNTLATEEDEDEFEFWFSFSPFFW